MARKKRIHVAGKGTLIDGAPSATMTIDTAAGLIGVRPFRRRREYILPLASVAQMIVYRTVTAEVESAKRKRYKVKRGLL